MLLLAINSCCMLAGTWVLQARLMAGVCGCCCCCLNLAAIITIGVFRFNAWGKLSALCEGPSKFENDDGGTLNLSDDHTVANDASLILGLWVCQMIWCCTNCCHSGVAGKAEGGSSMSRNFR